MLHVKIWQNSKIYYFIIFSTIFIILPIKFREKDELQLALVWVKIIFFQSLYRGD